MFKINIKTKREIYKEGTEVLDHIETISTMLYTHELQLTFDGKNVDTDMGMFTPIISVTVFDADIHDDEELLVPPGAKWSACHMRPGVVTFIPYAI